MRPITQRRASRKAAGAGAGEPQKAIGELETANGGEGPARRLARGAEAARCHRETCLDPQSGCRPAQGRPRGSTPQAGSAP